MLVCIQCAMEAMVKGEVYQGEGDESIAAHNARLHADLTATRARRTELERLIELMARAAREKTR